MPRTTLLAASALAALPCLAHAEDRLGLLDLFALDRIERELGLARALELQRGLTGAGDIGIGSCVSLEQIRDRAARHMTGAGAPRSRRLAVFRATLGAATGDLETADILAELDGRARGAARDACRAAEAEASALAVDLWLARDLPAGFRPQSAWELAPPRLNPAPRFHRSGDDTVFLQKDRLLPWRMRIRPNR